MKKIMMIIAAASVAVLAGCRVVEVENRGEEIARDADGKPVTLSDGTIQTVKKGWSVYHGQHWMTTKADSLSASVKKEEIDFALNGLNTEPSERLGELVDKSLTGAATLATKVGAAVATGGCSLAGEAGASALATAIGNYISAGGSTESATVTVKDGDVTISDGKTTETCTDCVVK